MANIETNTETWNGHNLSEIELHIKTRMDGMTSTAALEDVETTLITALANHNDEVDSHITAKDSEIDEKLADNEATLMAAYAALEDRISALENK